MEIQIEMPNKTAVKNFVKWFRKEGFNAFAKSKYNKLKSSDTDSYIICLATDEKLVDSNSGQYAGQFIELQ